MYEGSLGNNMASATITTTAPIGPDLTVTALIDTGARKLEYDFERNVFTITDINSVITEYDFETIATITHTISGEVSTITITT